MSYATLEVEPTPPSATSRASKLQFCACAGAADNTNIPMNTHPVTRRHRNCIHPLLNELGEPKTDEVRLAQWMSLAGHASAHAGRQPTFDGPWRYEGVLSLHQRGSTCSRRSAPPLVASNCEG